MLLALLGGKQKDPVTAPLELEPRKVDFGIKRFDVYLTIAHLNDQRAGVSEVIRGFSQHSAHQIQPV